MTIRHRWAIAGLVLVTAVFGASCSDVSSETPTDSGTGAGSGNAPRPPGRRSGLRPPPPQPLSTWAARIRPDLPRFETMEG